MSDVRGGMHDARRDALQRTINQKCPGFNIDDVRRWVDELASEHDLNLLSATKSSDCPTLAFA
jgi:hypothetical protein